MNKTKKQLEKENKELKEKLTLESHTKKYIHIPKPPILPIIGIIIFGILSYYNLYFIDLELIKVVFSSNEIIEQFTFKFSHLINIYPIIGEYILLSLTMISITALFKGGYNKIKSYKEKGLIAGLIAGLIVGLIAGLI
ncbi:MAG: hypothetical protein ACOC3Z_02190, partial [Nanoarchaeota archaeon]